ncbi:prepilin-type N-terminal cleavage/methylation domain-containing protein [Patescibacteria group bacterium]|nr:prepilin-type N-terminal cleavage/methylation domain-containing protein [Patescibacteria group bacterium]
MKNYSKQDNKNKRKAFTLVEVLLYVTVLGICLGAMAGFMNMVNSAKTKNKIILELERQGENIVTVIKKEIINSSEIIKPIPASSHNEIELSSLDQNLNPIIIKLENGIIKIKYASDPAIALNGGSVSVKNLEFLRLDNLNSSDSIIINFDLETGAGLDYQEFIYQRNFNFAISRRH